MRTHLLLISLLYMGISYATSPIIVHRFDSLSTEQASLYLYPVLNHATPTLFVVICPGGSYAQLAMEHEGHEMAQLLNEMGVGAAVLKYRMPNGRREIPLSDAKWAIKEVRNNATTWHLNPQKVGICGYSAGGHLASTLLTHHQADNRPNFGILFYPVISMYSPQAHEDSRRNLLGEQSHDATLQHYYSAQQNTTAETPPTLLFANEDDTEVSAQNSRLFHQALMEANVPSELHTYPTGGHGWGCHHSFIYRNEWIQTLKKWIKKQ